MGKRPTHEYKLGRIRAAIWANETADHDVWFNVTVTRTYKQGDSWKETSALGRDDLPIAVKAMDMAYAWIWRKKVQVDHAERNAANKVLARVGSAA